MQIVLRDRHSHGCAEVSVRDCRLDPPWNAHYVFKRVCLSKDFDYEEEQHGCDVWGSDSGWLARLPPPPSPAKLSKDDVSVHELDQSIPKLSRDILSADVLA